MTALSIIGILLTAIYSHDFGWRSGYREGWNIGYDSAMLKINQALHKRIERNRMTDKGIK